MRRAPSSRYPGDAVYGGRVTGPAATVVCLHGLRRTPADWDGVRRGLPAVWRVEAPALPADPDRALAVADTAIGEGCFVLAHSMGAVVAMRLLAERPRSLAGVVLTGSFHPPARNGRSRAATIGDYLGHRVSLVREVGARERTDARSERSRRALVSLLRQATRRRGVEAPGGVGSPVLVVHARDDHHVPVDFAIAAAARHPEWTLRLLDRGGHHAHVDHPALWLDEVLPWLSRHSDGVSPGT